MLVVLFEQVMDLLRGRALLEEMHHWGHWGLALKAYSLVLLLLLPPLCFLCGGENVTIQLPLPRFLCLLSRFPVVTDSIPLEP